MKKYTGIEKMMIRYKYKTVTYVIMMKDIHEAIRGVSNGTESKRKTLWKIKVYKFTDTIFVKTVVMVIE